MFTHVSRHQYMCTGLYTCGHIYCINLVGLTWSAMWFQDSRQDIPSQIGLNVPRRMRHRLVSRVIWSAGSLSFVKPANWIYRL